jgi:hypothetical protein
MAAKFSRRRRGRDRFETHDARNVVAWGCQQGAAPNPNAESILPGKVRLQEERQIHTRRRQVKPKACDPASFPSEYLLNCHSIAPQLVAPAAPNSSYWRRL